MGQCGINSMNQTIPVASRVIIDRKSRRRFDYVANLTCDFVPGETYRTADRESSMRRRVQFDLGL